MQLAIQADRSTRFADGSTAQSRLAPSAVGQLLTVLSVRRA